MEAEKPESPEYFEGEVWLEEENLTDVATPEPQELSTLQTKVAVQTALDTLEEEGESEELAEIKNTEPVQKQENLEQQVELLDGGHNDDTNEGDKDDSEAMQLKSNNQEPDPFDKSTYCKFCFTTWPDMETFASHIFMMHLTQLKVCTLCYQAFVVSAILHDHVVGHETGVENYYNCSQCTKKFHSKKVLEWHEYKFHKNTASGMFLRDVCPFVSLLLCMSFRKFLRGTTVRTTHYTCVVCGMYTQSLKKYLQHLKGEKKCKVFGACDRCSDVFADANQLKKHVLDNRCIRLNRLRELKFKNKVVYECVRCKETFPRVKLYHAHKSNCMAYYCPECEINFDGLVALQRHQTETHTYAAKAFICKYCYHRVTIVGERAMQRHMQKAHPDLSIYKYVCVQCDRYYKHPQKLFGHFFGQHPDMQPYLCKLCDKTFRVRRKFTLHIKLEHKSNGTVSFDEKFNVIFSDKPLTNVNADKIDDSMTKGVNDTCSSNTIIVSNQANMDAQNIASTNKFKQDTQKKYHAGKDNCLIKREILNTTKDDDDDDDDDISDSVESKKSGAKKVSKVLTRSMVKKRKFSKKRARYASSSDDEPLSKKKNMQVKTLRKNAILKNIDKSKLICTSCRKIYPNKETFTHHLKLHFKRKPNECVKCKQIFKCLKDLNAHIVAKHKNAKSYLRLKNILQKCQTKRKHHSTQSNLIKGTIKNVMAAKSATASLNPKNLPVFEPHMKKVTIGDLVIKQLTDEEPPKTLEDDNTMTIQQIYGSDVDHFFKIRMNQIPVEKPKPFVQLAMPYTFAFEKDAESKVEIKELEDDAIPFDPPKLHFGEPACAPLLGMYEDRNFPDDVKLNYGEPIYTESAFDFSKRLDEANVYQETADQTMDSPDFHHYDNNSPDNYDYMNEQTANIQIPDVAQEIQLENVEQLLIRDKKNNIVATKLPKEFLNVKVATLIPEKPYYKLVKLKEILMEAEKKEEKVQKMTLTVPEIGKKLVNVNPLQHLIGPDTPLTSTTNKYYKKKQYNASEIIAKALSQIHTPAEKKSRKAKAKSNITEATTAKELLEQPIDFNEPTHSRIIEDE